MMVPHDVWLSALATGASELIEIAGMFVFQPATEFDGPEVINCDSPMAKSRDNNIIAGDCPDCVAGWVHKDGCYAEGRVENTHDCTPVACARCNGMGILAYRKSETGFEPVDVEVAAAKLPGTTVKPPTPLTDLEKTVSRSSFDTFLAMREATRLQESKA